MNNITEFNFNSMDVRVIDKDNNPWFVLNDVCKILEINNPSQAISYLDDDEKNTLIINEGNRGNPEKAIINESGLYSLVLRSRKPEAKRFKKWVTSEVLPAIRKTGSYQSVDLNDPVFLRSTLLTYADKCLVLESENKELKLKADGYDLIVHSDGCMLPRDVAKDLKIQLKVLTDLLLRRKWAFRCKRDNRLKANHKTVKYGYVIQNVIYYPEYHTTREQLLITPKGLAKLATIFAGEAA